MKIILYVFSGTGNTLDVATLYKTNFEQQGHEVSLYRISAHSGDAPNPANYDMVGFGYPIHAFNAPKPFVDFCKTLPAMQQKPAFFFKSSGEGLHLNDCSSQKTYKILKKKGYAFYSERHIVMPYNMIYRHTNGMAKQMWIYAQAMVKLHTTELLQGKQEKVKQPLYKTWYAPLFRIEWYFAPLHGHLFRADKKCINCGKCITACPMKNISQNKKGKICFGGNCALCMACSFGCPQNAIHVGIFKFWKVHGSYHVRKLAADSSIPFPYLNGSERGIYKLYRKYYRECDALLSQAHISPTDFLP
jgi:flavodoxin/ferredoxin-like protein FixX